MSEPKPINVAEYEPLAEARCEPGYWGYVTGGAGDESFLSELEPVRQKYANDALLKAGALKIMLDGVTESHTASMLEPFIEPS